MNGDFYANKLICTEPNVEILEFMMKESDPKGIPDDIQNISQFGSNRPSLEHGILVVWAFFFLNLTIKIGYNSYCVVGWYKRWFYDGPG